METIADHKTLFRPQDGRWLGGVAEGLARYYANRALSRLAEKHIPAALRDELLPVADAVLGRVK